MDYTKVPRTLIYRDRKSLNEFIEGSNLNAVIVDNMQDVDVLMMDDFEARALTCLNAAYYICTLILMEEHPEWRIPFFIDYPRKLEKYHTDKFQIVILSLVVIFLEHLDEQWQLNHERIIERIKTHIDDSTLYSGTIDTHGSQFTAEKLDYIFQSLVSGTNQDFILSDKDFAPRNILDEDIPAIDIVEWSEYLIETVKKIPTTSQKNKVIKSLLYRLDQIQVIPDSPYDRKRNEIKGILENLGKPVIVVTPWLSESLKQSAIKEKQSETKEQTDPQQSVDDTPRKIRVELDKAYDRIKELKEENTDLKNTIAELQQPVEEMPAAQKVRMELIFQLLRKAGLTDDVLRQQDNKQKVATVMSILLDIHNKNKRGNEAQTCATYLSARDLSRSRHEETINKINALLKELNIDVQI